MRAVSSFDAELLVCAPTLIVARPLPAALRITNDPVELPKLIVADDLVSDMVSVLMLNRFAPAPRIRLPLPALLEPTPMVSRLAVTELLVLARRNVPLTRWPKPTFITPVAPP